MENIIPHNINTVLTEMNVEIERPHSKLELAKEKTDELQQQTMSDRGDDILPFRDEDYFENGCEPLC